MITTVIFDLDGLLVDTEQLHYCAYQTALRARGATLTESDYVEHWVRSGKGIVEWVSDHGLNLDPHEVRTHKSKCYIELLSSSLRPMEGAVELLQTLSGKKNLALASSSYRDAVDGVLEGLHLAHYFKTIVSGLDVTRVKPAPDIFLVAARQAGADPFECVVLEDAEKGVVAAYHAGMRCIAVPNAYTRHHDFSKATQVCSSLKEITLEIIETIGA